MRSWWRGARFATSGMLLGLPSLGAQSPDSAAALAAAPIQVRSSPHRVAEPLAIAAFGMMTLLALDAPARELLQDHRSRSLDAVAGGARQLGEWRTHVVLPVALGLVGLVAGDAGLVRTGAELGASALAVAGAATGLKYTFGRQRPRCACGPLTFEALGEGQAFPSGHTAAAFAAASVVAVRVDRPWIRAALYGGATLTAWSRMNDDKHWLSDVVAGAVLGHLTARAVTGRLKLGARSAPRVAATPDGVGVEWRMQF